MDAVLKAELEQSHLGAFQGRVHETFAEKLVADTVNMLSVSFAKFPFNSFACLHPEVKDLGGDCLDLSLEAIDLLQNAQKHAHLLPVYNTKEAKGKPEHFMVGIPFYHKVDDDPLLNNAGLVLVEFGLHIPIPIICRWSTYQAANSCERVPLELPYHASFFDSSAKLFTITLDTKNPEWLQFTTLAKPDQRALRPQDTKKYIHLKPYTNTQADKATAATLVQGISEKMFPYFAIYRGFDVMLKIQFIRFGNELGLRIGTNKLEGYSPDKIDIAVDNAVLDPKFNKDNIKRCLNAAFLYLAPEAAAVFQAKKK